MRVHVSTTSLSGVVLIETDCFRDERGFFIEPWNQRDFQAAGLNVTFVQEGHSRSNRRVIRGLHYQDMTAPMGKLVRCTVGEIFDVAVDLRVGSATFGKWFAVELTAENHRQVYIPPGFAHGFQALSAAAEVQYKQTAFYTPSSEGGVLWNDGDLGIPWPISDPLLSTRDTQALHLKDYLRAPAFRIEQFQK
jgi:dTDP-4-dehydrorhamnose 3,5-epimerase